MNPSQPLNGEGVGRSVFLECACPHHPAKAAEGCRTWLLKLGYNLFEFRKEDGN